MTNSYDDIMTVVYEKLILASLCFGLCNLLC